MNFGTAPRRAQPGVWFTRTGAQLTPAQTAIWEHYYSTGATDGLGHFNHGVLHAQAMRNVAQKVAQSHHLSVAEQYAQGKINYQNSGDNGLKGIVRGAGHLAEGAAHGIGHGMEQLGTGLAASSSPSQHHRDQPSSVAVPRAIQRTSAQVIGPNLTSAITGKHYTGTGLALDAALLPTFFLGPFRGVRGGVALGRALAAGKGIEEAGKAASVAYHGPGFTRQLADKAAMRTFRVGNATHSIPRAGSLTGHALETATDRLLRPVASRAGLMKSEAERAVYERGVTERHAQDVMDSSLNHLKAVGRKLTDVQEYALRHVLEGAPPAERTAFHTALAEHAAANGVKDQALYHAIHAHLSEQAGKYVEEAPNGGVQLRNSAPKKLHEALRAFSAVGTRREDLLSQFGKISDERIAARIHAPARVIKGARWKAYEDQINNYLENSPERAARYAEIDQIPGIPAEQKQHMKTILDARARTLLRRNLLETGHLGENFFGSVQSHVIPHDQLPPELKGLYQEGTPPAPEMPDQLPPDVVHKLATEIRSNHKLPQYVQANLEQRIAHVYELVKQGAAYRDWYDRAGAVLKDAAKRMGLSNDQFAKQIAISSPRAMPTENLRRAVTLIHGEHGTLPEGAKTFEGLPANVAKGKRVLAGAEFAYNPRNPKTHNYYRNLLESMDPKTFAKLGLEPGVTVDVHATNAIAPELNGEPKQFYEGLGAVYKGIAKELGWSPREVQAAAWVPQKAIHDAARYGGEPAQYMGTAQDAYEAGRAQYRGTLYQLDHGQMPHEGHTQWDVVRGVQDTLNGSGGHTWNPDLSSFKTDSGYAVGIAPDRGLEIPAGKFSEADVQDYARANADLLRSTPGLKIGSWKEGDTVYLDLSRVYPVGHLRDAAEAGVAAGQKAIFDFGNMQDIQLPASLDELRKRLERYPQHVFRPGDNGPGAINTPNTLFQGAGDFHAAAADELQAHAALARDIARTLPEDEWPQWVKNQIRTQAVGPEQPLHLRGIDQAGPQYDMPNHVPGDWMAQEPQLGGMSGQRIKGAYTPAETPGARAVINFIHYASGYQSADITTVAHEFMHHIRQGMSLEEEGRLAAWAKATPIREKGVGGKLGKITGYKWGTPQEERVARGFEKLIYDGRGPSPIMMAFEALSPDFRAAYESGELPDLPPKIAKGLMKLFGAKPLKGGSLVGWEDVHVGSGYAPVWAGVPATRQTTAQKAFSSYMRKMKGVFAGGTRRAVGAAGPQDAALTHEYRAGLLLSGFFTPDVIGPMIEKAMVANRMAAFKRAHEFFVQVGSDIPSDYTDVPIWKEPLKGKQADQARQKLRVLWDKMDSTQDKHALTRDLQGVDWNLTGAMHEALFNLDKAGAPQEIAGKSAAELAHEIITNNKPIDGLVWVPRHILDTSGTLMVPSTSNTIDRVLNHQQRNIKSALGLSVDAVNDLQKAMILYFNPAYIPVNLIGNLGMNLLQQGAFMPVNLWRAVLMHREMTLDERRIVDAAMGSGLVRSLGGRTTPGKVLHATMGHYINMAVDLIPRRTAFLHEAYKEGYGIGGRGGRQDLTKLLHDAQNGDQNALAVMDRIQRRAKDAIVDYDRMSEFEKNIVARWIFFYPWLRGATRYSIRFIAEHPLMSMGLAMAYEHAQQVSQQQLGDRPYYDQWATPLSTESLGLKGPGFNVGLDQLVGKHELKNAQGLPMTINFRQLFTQTTPAELGQDFWAFATSGNPEAAGDVVSHLTPLLYAGGIALYGRDPFKGADVPQNFDTFLQHLGPTQTPAYNDYNALFNMSPRERALKNAKAISPRTRGQDVVHTFLGGLSPTPYNPKVGQARALENKPTLERKTVQLTQAAHDAGMQKPPPQAYEDLKWMVKLDKAIHKNQPWSERWKVLAQLYDERNGTNYSAMNITTEGQAREAYAELRPNLYPYYSAWYSQAKQINDARAATQPVVGG